MASAQPSIGWHLLHDSGLLQILPELARLKGVAVVKGHGHKDNFLHTMGVLDSVAAKSDNIRLRWAALFHDIAKPVTKHFDSRRGWTFHNHNFMGAKMMTGIFSRMKFPQNAEMRYMAEARGPAHAAP